MGKFKPGFRLLELAGGMSLKVVGITRGSCTAQEEEDMKKDAAQFARLFFRHCLNEAIAGMPGPEGTTWHSAQR